jgi:hemolysin III
MGWLAIVALKPLAARLSIQGISWMAAGGIIFSLGVIFYVFKKLRFHHAIWHLFVLMGCACHFFSILFYVLPL